MIQRFIDLFLAAKETTIADLRKAHPEGYDALFQRLVTLLGVDEDQHYGDTPDPKRVTVIDHGDYQGSRLFVVGAKGYQPYRYWATLVGYGSCSGCDSFEAIHGYTNELPTEKQATEYWTLMLHMVQGLRVIE